MERRVDIPDNKSMHKPVDLRYRQIHLDFHTSEQIKDIGKEFTKKNFQEALKVGRVNSITVFSKCHHGLSYHDTKVGVKHPHLAKPLLPLMIEACQEIDVKTPIYVSAGLDEQMAQKHPEWLVKNKEGVNHNPFHVGFKRLCFNSPYLDYLCAQIEEVAQMFPGHGLFLDIIGTVRCYCTTCMSEMIATGVDAQTEEGIQGFAEKVSMKYYKKTTEAFRKHNKDSTIFHNSGHITRGYKAVFPYQSHLELESLPTGGWGYDHFPVSAKYAATTGFDFLGMTGKFHTTWGEFGGFKKPEALRYEAAAMLAFGAKCSIGDQLHPNGLMDASTYELVGAAYREVEVIEEICRGAKSFADVAILSSESVKKGFVGARNDDHSDEGAARILLEKQIPFDVIDTEDDFGRYKLLILPDHLMLDKELAAKFKTFLSRGGKALLSGTSGMDPEQKAFAFDTGMKPLGESEWTNDYLHVSQKDFPRCVASPFVTYSKAQKIAPGKGRILGEVWEPYFNRDYKHFCSHQHTPPEKKASYPGIVLEGSIGYFAHPIFSLYRKLGQPLYKELVAGMIEKLLGDEAQVKTNLPSTARLSLMKKEKQIHLHLLHAVPMKRGELPLWSKAPIEIIEDEIPLHGVEISLKLPQKIAKIRTVGIHEKNEEIPFTPEQGRVKFRVDSVKTHKMLVLEV